MVLKGSTCYDAPHKTIFYSEFFMQASIDSGDLGFTRFSTNYGEIAKDNGTTLVCMGGIYKWEILGLYKTEHTLIYKNDQQFAIT